MEDSRSTRLHSGTHTHTHAARTPAPTKIRKKVQNAALRKREMQTQLNFHFIISRLFFFRYVYFDIFFVASPSLTHSSIGWRVNFAATSARSRTDQPANKEEEEKNVQLALEKEDHGSAMLSRWENWLSRERAQKRCKQTHGSKLKTSKKHPNPYVSNRCTNATPKCVHNAAIKEGVEHNQFALAARVSVSACAHEKDNGNRTGPRDRAKIKIVALI